MNSNLINYDKAKREEDIRRLLQPELKKTSDLILRASNKTLGPVEDIAQHQIEDIKEKSDELSVDIKNLVGPHFTKEYRALRERIVRYQVRLDAIEREDLREARRKVLNQLNELADQLEKKTHTDGKLCPDCELTTI